MAPLIFFVGLTVFCWFWAKSDHAYRKKRRAMHEERDRQDRLREWREMQELDKVSP